MNFKCTCKLSSANLSDRKWCIGVRMIFFLSVFLLVSCKMHALSRFPLALETRCLLGRRRFTFCHVYGESGSLLDRHQWHNYANLKMILSNLGLKETMILDSYAKSINRDRRETVPAELAIRTLRWPVWTQRLRRLPYSTIQQSKAKRIQKFCDPLSHRSSSFMDAVGKRRPVSYIIYSTTVFFTGRGFTETRLFASQKLALNEIWQLGVVSPWLSRHLQSSAFIFSFFLSVKRVACYSDRYFTLAHQMHYMYHWVVLLSAEMNFFG